MEKCVAAVFKTEPDWGGPHLCHKALDRLAGYVNDGILQTVVDQVYTPDDAEKAILHICSPKAIGGTIITFRSWTDQNQNQPNLVTSDLYFLILSFFVNSVIFDFENKIIKRENIYCATTQV